MPDAGRVIAGTPRACASGAPGEGTRPLSDKVKQALFASLESEFGDAWPVPFLDLFAGQRRRGHRGAQPWRAAGGVRGA